MAARLSTLVGCVVYVAPRITGGWEPGSSQWGQGHGNPPDEARRWGSNPHSRGKALSG